METWGSTFPIAEPDALKEIEQRASQINWQSALSKPPAHWGARKSSAKLPRALKSVVRRLVPSYTLERDIVDKDGNIIYPAGFAYKPLEFMPVMPFRIIVIGDDDDDVAWFEKNGRPTDVVLVSGGDPVLVGKRVGQRAYLVGRREIDRLGLRVIPSVVAQEGEQLVINEYALPGS
ncbi:MAG: conjugal transfer protein TraW [Gammaproteobacteria bacterium]